MKASGSQLIKVAILKGLVVYQDMDTGNLYLEVLGSLTQVNSIASATRMIEVLGIKDEVNQNESKSSSSN